MYWDCLKLELTLRERFYSLIRKLYFKDIKINLLIDLIKLSFSFIPFIVFLNDATCLCLKLIKRILIPLFHFINSLLVNSVLLYRFFSNFYVWILNTIMVIFMIYILIINNQLLYNLFSFLIFVTCLSVKHKN